MKIKNLMAMVDYDYDIDKVSVTVFPLISFIIIDGKKRKLKCEEEMIFNVNWN